MEIDDLRTVRVAACDLNGQMRGKRVPSDAAAKLANGAMRMPISVLNVDLTGADIDQSPLVFETGDADGMLRPTGRDAMPMPWLTTSSALIPAWMFREDGAPFDGDPRHALAAVLARYEARGLRVMAATEMEFYLMDDSGPMPAPAINPTTGQPLTNSSTLSLAELDGFDALFSDLYEGCAAMGIPAGSASAEAGPGQFEIDLAHTDALRAADNAWLFKTLTRGMARKHGTAASFMAKPFADQPGNGMHVHFSVLDADGRNIFDDGGDHGTALLRQAIAGCLRAMPASTLIFAPHGSSYDRLVPGAHAPTGVCWGYENRTGAIRVPGGPPAARRIEHRVAGGDINPYLMLAVVLGAALTGIEDALEAPAPLTGNAYEQDMPQLAPNWAEAIAAFETDPIIARILPSQMIDNLCRTKRQEMGIFHDASPEARWRMIYETV